MRLQDISSIAFAMCTTSCAYAQIKGQATWLWDVSTDDGDTIVEPGEAAAVTLSVLMELAPNVPPGTGVKFGGCEFDTLGAAGAGKGAIGGWVIHNNLADLVGDQTTTDGVSLFHTLVQQPGLHNHILDNPIDVITFYWTPTLYSNYDVQYSTVTSLFDFGDHKVQVFAGPPDEEDPFVWPISEASIVFGVVPSPISAAVIGLASLFLARRNR